MKSPVPSGTQLSLPSFPTSRQESHHTHFTNGGTEAQRGALAEGHLPGSGMNPGSSVLTSSSALPRVGVGLDGRQGSSSIVTPFCASKTAGEDPAHKSCPPFSVPKRGAGKFRNLLVNFYLIELLKAQSFITKKMVLPKNTQFAITLCGPGTRERHMLSRE